MNYIIYQTKTQFENTGDALINNSLITELRKYGAIVANCGSDVPKEFLNELGIKEDEKLIVDSEVKFALQVLKYATLAFWEKDQVYIFTGLGDVSGGNVKTVVKNIITGIVFGIYKLFGVKVIRIGRSLGPISRSMSISERFKAGFLTNNFVRDTNSLETYKRIKVKKVEFCPDMSWLYEGNANRKFNDEKCVLLNFRANTCDQIDETYEKLLSDCIAKVLEVINKSLDSDMRIIIAYQVKRDKRFCLDLHERFKHNYSVEFIDKQMKLEDFEKIYSQSRYHLSNRMHSLFVGYKYGSLPIAILDEEKNIKISFTMSDNDLKCLMLDISNENISNKTREIMRQEKLYFEKIITCERKNRIEIQKVLQRIFYGKGKKSGNQT